MVKNNLTNKITPCGGLPFSVVYWWVSNLMLNSEADRQFILSKISQTGAIPVDAWKVLINSATLEADASLTKSEFLEWFDCGRQPSKDRFKIIIESLKVGNWDSFKQTVEELNEALDAYKVELNEKVDEVEIQFLPKYSQTDEVAETIIQRVDQNTGGNVNFKVVTNWIDGSAMTDAKVDGGIFIKKGEIYYQRQFEGAVNLKWFGAKGNGSTNDTVAIQKAVDYCNQSGISLFIPEGIYLANAPILFNKARAITNSTKFGMTIYGEGRSTIIKYFGAGNVLFDMYSTTDVQINIKDLTIEDGTYRTNFGIRLGRLKWYSVFENVRILGFKQGIAFHQPIYRMTFNDVFIRGCEQSIVVDSGLLGVDVLTELSFNRCYFDNNGMDKDTSHMILYNVQESKFNDCIFEGNFSFGVEINGQSENIIFNSCRFEETEINTGLNSGHILAIGNTVRNVVFRMCEIAYNQKGVNGTKNYSLIYVGNEVVFEHCQFIDVGDQNPSNVFGATPETARVQVVGGYTGIGDYYKVNIPNRYKNTRVGNSYIWENGGLLLKKINGFPTTDTDGVEL